MIQVDYTKLKKLVKDAGKTMSGLSLELGYSKSYLDEGKLLNRGGLRTIEANYICEALGCNIEDLKPSDRFEEPTQTHTRADELTDEELVQEIMKRLLRKGGR